MPYGFPSGADLKRQILDIHNIREDNQKLLELGFDAGVLGEFQRRFQASHLASIDLFLKQWPAFADLGKSCIAACIGRVESTFARKFLDSNASLGDWYPMLWNALADVAESDFHSNNLSVITFNYDRSLEIFLSFAYANTYNISPSAAQFKFAQTVNIHHVYGDLGALTTATRDSFELGIEFSAADLKACQTSIRVIGDRAQEAIRAKCGDLIATADRVCFLGFGFAPENIVAINASRRNALTPATRFVCGSAFDIKYGQRVAAAKLCGVTTRLEGNDFHGMERFLEGGDCVSAIRHFGVLNAR